MWFLIQKLVYQVGALPTKVICLTQVVTADELKDDEEYEDIMEDMRLEAGKYGKSCEPATCYFSLKRII
jgi:splicing factor U2AF subunit